MTSSREEDERVMEILAAARRKQAGEREAYLQSACAGDEDLRREVVDALGWEERMGGFLQQPVAVIADGNPDSGVTGAVQFAAGLEIGQYRIESKLGEGGMSSVWLALDTRLGRRVAIKFLSDDLADAEARRRFQREAQMASSLNHPHIVTVYDTGEFEGRQYLVTEYVDGGTLKDWVKEKRRTAKEVAELLTGVADGLAAAHQAGILHRDIKPMNILVARNGYAKLADFGLAKLAEDGKIDLAARLPEGRTRPGLILGTIAYMSPEQASGQPLDSRSDIFSFGAVLYEMLSGKRPFGGQTDLEVLKTIIHGELPPLSEEVPEAYRNVVEKALEKIRRRDTSPCGRWSWISSEASARSVCLLLRCGRGDCACGGWRRPTRATRGRAFACAAKIKARVNLAWSLVEDRSRNIRHCGHRPCSRSRLSMASAAESAGAGGLDCRSVYGSARTGDFPGLLPDGSRIAFAWNGDAKGRAKGFDLYVKALGSETLLRLTQHPSEWISPTWSPDGTQVAFHRVAGADTGIYVVPRWAAPRENYAPPELPVKPARLLVGRRTASGSHWPMHCQKRNIQESISSPRTHWRSSRFQSVHSAIASEGPRSPTMASTSRTGVLEGRKTTTFCIRCRFRAVSRK